MKLKKYIERLCKQAFGRKIYFDDKLSNAALFRLLLEMAINLFRGVLKTSLSLKSQLIFIGKGSLLVNVNGMELGKGIRIGKGCALISQSKQDLCIGSQVSIGDYSKLVVSTSVNSVGEGIEIGESVGIGEFSYIGGGGGVVIGRDTIIGQYFSVHPENHKFSDRDTLIRFQGTTRKGVSIGKNCWVGAKVTICDGVSIGNNCVVAAGSVVTKDFASNCIIGGVPAKVLKKTVPEEVNHFQ
ncbi:hypothetical protein A134_00485 [Vibrio crassostreae 9CS106]|nr:hypothetical protein A134_00485 [Vibrio crassostreae 9CS106]